MPSKKIDGDLDITGEYKKNGSALASGTKLYKHSFTLSSPYPHSLEIITASNTPFLSLNDIVSASKTAIAFIASAADEVIFALLYFAGTQKYYLHYMPFLSASTAGTPTVIEVTGSTFIDTVTEL